MNGPTGMNAASRMVSVERPKTARSKNIPYTMPKAIALRQGKAISDVVVTEGYDGPQPMG